MASSFELALRDFSNKRPARVKADPKVGVDELVQPLKRFVTAKKNKDLYMLLLGGQSGHDAMKFRSIPNPEAICKVADLL